MTSGLKVAIVGATGVVGNAFLRVLEQRRFPNSSTFFYWPAIVRMDNRFLLLSTNIQ